MGGFFDNGGDRRLFDTLVVVELETPAAGRDDTFTADTVDIGGMGNSRAVLAFEGAGKGEGATAARVDIGGSVEALKAVLVTGDGAGRATFAAEQVVGNGTATTSGVAGSANGVGGDTRSVTFLGERGSVADKVASDGRTGRSRVGGVDTAGSGLGNEGRGDGSNEGREVECGQNLLEEIVDAGNVGDLDAEGSTEVGDGTSGELTCSVHTETDPIRQHHLLILLPDIKRLYERHEHTGQED